jgi:hypothetical protein
VVISRTFRSMGNPESPSPSSTARTENRLDYSYPRHALLFRGAISKQQVLNT